MKLVSTAIPWAPKRLESRKLGLPPVRGARPIKPSPAGGYRSSRRRHPHAATRAIAITMPAEAAGREGTTKRPTDAAVGLFTRHPTAKYGKTRTPPETPIPTEIPAKRPDSEAAAHDWKSWCPRFESGSRHRFKSAPSRSLANELPDAATSPTRPRAVPGAVDCSAAGTICWPLSPRISGWWPSGRRKSRRAPAAWRVASAWRTLDS